MAVMAVRARTAAIRRPLWTSETAWAAAFVVRYLLLFAALVVWPVA